jgi:hypothetical protein
MHKDLDIVLVNPLGAALHHYTASLQHLLKDCGAKVKSISLMEPSAPKQTRLRWLHQYVKTLRHAKRRTPTESASTIVIQTWPVLGYWDFAISRLLLRATPGFIILHDPRPLVPAVGYGRLARWIASRRQVVARAIVHSDAASQIVEEDVHLGMTTNLPHPMFPPDKREKPAGRVIVRVLGQYKADRDLAAMEQLVRQGSQEWRYEVVGRDWPSIAGWKVTSKFVDENAFDSLIRTSSAILIPYVRFFQSGVAIRSLELGTPIVGPRCSSLRTLLGTNSQWLVDESTGSWTRAVEAAIEANPQEIFRAASTAYDNALRGWREWLAEARSPI